MTTIVPVGRDRWLQGFRRSQIDMAMQRRWSIQKRLLLRDPVVFEHACRMGLEGIVSKRKGSRYQSGRSRDWIKTKNTEAPVVTRLAEEDWASVMGLKQRREMFEPVATAC